MLMLIKYFRGSTNNPKNIRHILIYVSRRKNKAELRSYISKCSLKFVIQLNIKPINR